jgi:hypothetical protein
METPKTLLDAVTFENTQYQNVVPAIHEVVPAIHENVELGSRLFTDEVVSYFGLSSHYAHSPTVRAETGRPSSFFCFLGLLKRTGLW